jgi:hypothetical protein
MRPIIATKLQTARIRDHVGLSERQRMRRTAIWICRFGYQKQKPPPTSSAEEVSATLALDHAIVKTESIDDVRYHEALVETKDTERQVHFPPVDAKDGVGVRIPCQGVAAAMTFALFTAANSGDSPEPAKSIDLHFALGPLRFHILLAK